MADSKTPQEYKKLIYQQLASSVSFGRHLWYNL